jgi:hypothetical protein
MSAKNKKKGVLSLLAGLSTMKVEDIPLAPGVNVEVLKAGDTDPMEVVVEVPATKSKRGWNYTPVAIKKIVDHVNQHTLNGFLGHQKPENVANEFLDIATHWVGATFDESKNVGYFRGVVDSTATKLKRWIRAKRIKQVSIYGMPTLARAAGEVNVVDYKPLSIDWTPLDRPGMPTRIVAVGEMAHVFDTVDDTVLIDGEMEDIFDIIAGEQGGETVDKAKLLAALKAMVASGEITKADMDAIVGEMFKTEGTVITGEMATLVTGVSVEDMKAMKTVFEKTKEEAALKAVGEMVDTLIQEKVKGEEAQKWVKEVFSTTAAVKETVAGEMDVFLGKESVKVALSKLYDTKSVHHRGPGNEENGSLRVRKATI